MSDESVRSVVGCDFNYSNYFARSAPIVFVHESALVAATKRIHCPAGENYTLPVGNMATLVYDEFSARYMIAVQPIPVGDRYDPASV